MSTIWISGLGLAMSMFFNSEAIEFQFKNKTYYDCRETWDETDGKTYTIILFIITFVLPIKIIFFVYISMICAVYKRKLNGNVSLNLKKQKIQV